MNKMTGTWKYHGKLAAGSSGKTSETLANMRYNISGDSRVLWRNRQKAITACNTVTNYETCHISAVISELTFHKLASSENA